MSDLDDTITAVLHDALDGHTAQDGRAPIAAKVRGRRRVKMFRNVAATVVVTAVAAGVAFSVLPAGSSKQRSVIVPAGPSASAPPTTVGLVTIPVVACPTRYAATPLPAVRLPTSVSLHVPDALTGQLAVYIDRADMTRVVGPKDWNCVSYYTPDFSGGQTGGVDVYPPGEVPPPAWSWGPQPNWMTQVVSIYESGRKPLLAAAQACAYFPAAASYLTSHGSTCSSLPRSETVSQVNAATVGFDIPPKTTDWTGPNADNGIETYSPTVTTQPGHYEGNCMLTPSDHDVCTAMLDYAIALYGGTTPGT